MNKLRIAVATICLNESQFVERFMNTALEADGVFVFDTGSTDDTVEKLKKLGAEVKVGVVKPWRFDLPRNIAHQMVPADYDVVVSIDLDEVFTPGWRAALEAAWTPETTRMRYQYAWSHNEDGSDGVTFWYDKIVKRHGYRWVKPVHEIMINSEPEVQTFADGFKLHHWPDNTKSRGSYLPLLELAVREEPEDDRSSHYLGREYMFYGMHDKSITELKRHLELKRATWHAERCASMRFIARGYSSLGQPDQAVSWALKACAESPADREPWYELAQASYKAPREKQDWHMVKLACTKALQIVERPASYICEPAAWGYEIYDLLALAHHNLGEQQEAINAGLQAIELNPTDSRLRNNLSFYRGQ